LVETRNGSPNKALHRTPSASPPSPVSFKTFGDVGTPVLEV
jgi:hypothetical protein